MANPRPTEFAGALKFAKQPHKEEVTCLYYEPSTSTLVSSSWDRSIILNDETVQSALVPVNVIKDAHSSDITAVTASPPDQVRRCFGDVCLHPRRYALLALSPSYRSDLSLRARLISQCAASTLQPGILKGCAQATSERSQPCALFRAIRCCCRPTRPARSSSLQRDPAQPIRK
jgi:hypothetical protein